MNTQKMCPVMSGPVAFPGTSRSMTHVQHCIGSRCAAWEPGMFDSRLGNCGLAHFGQRFPDPARTETEAST